MAENASLPLWDLDAPARGRMPESAEVAERQGQRQRVLLALYETFAGNPYGQSILGDDVALSAGIALELMGYATVECHRALRPGLTHEEMRDAREGTPSWDALWNHERRARITGAGIRLVEDSGALREAFPMAQAEGVVGGG